MTRSLFAGSNLNLNVYGGYQQVYSIKNLIFDKVEFSLQLNERGRIDFIFNKTAEGSRAIRFINNSRELRLLKLDKENRFIDVQNHFLRESISNRVDVVLSKQKNKVSLKVNNEEIPLNNDFVFEGKIGFIGNYSSGKVNFIDVFNGRVVEFSDDFSPVMYKKFSLFLLFVFVLISIPFVLRNRLLNLLFFSLIFCILAFFDYYSSSREFYWDWYDFTPKESLENKFSFEKYRFSMSNYLLKILEKPQLDLGFLSDYTKSFSANRGDIICDKDNCSESRNEYSVKKNDLIKSPFRILMASGSFGLGAGLSDNRDIFSHLLVNSIFNKSNYTLVNLPFDGRYDLDNIFKELSTAIEKYRPNVFIFNLFVEKKGDSYPKLLSFLKKYSSSVKIVVVEQVYQIDKIKIAYKQNYYAYNNLLEIGVYYLDINSFLFTDEFKNIGITHWDSGHLTKLGHQELANHYKNDLKMFFKVK